MEIHNVFAHDIDGEDLASRLSIAIKKEQIISKQGLGLEDQIGRRQSMVNIKGFVKELQQNFSVQTEENELAFSDQPLNPLLKEKESKLDQLSENSKEMLLMEKINKKDVLDEQISKIKGKILNLNFDRR